MIRTKRTFGLAIVALMFTGLTAVAVGKYPIDLATLGRLVLDLFDPRRTGSHLDAPALVLWTVRLPRILMAVLTSAALSVSGVVFQSLFMAGISYIKCKADPLGQLPAIVFWTMGSFTSVARKDAAWARS